ncbi:MAG: PQQ-binding-like beta-propeller repeat protein, partial [Pseudomonadota bacterium]|nr:PQQ-binding-like beta-propeller repeat protein [Pseudomonadota bacterium]
MPRKVSNFKVLICCGAALLISGCGLGFLGEKQNKIKVSGVRTAVISKQSELKPDASLNKSLIELPFPENNKNWSQKGGNATHVMKHIQLGDSPKIIWEKNIGDGETDGVSLTATPIVLDNKVVTLDTSGRVRAFRLRSGELQWETNLKPNEKDGAFGGGLGSGQNKVFISLGSGELVCLSIKDGKELWRTSTGRALRSAPSFADGRIFVTSLDNKAIAFSAISGNKLWTHNGMMANAALLGAASPAINNNAVVVAYSSGELYALKADNGRVFWGDNLSGRRGTIGAARISHIRGNPVVDQNIVIATSHSGRVTALELKTGKRLWDLPVTSKTMPWIVGDYLYIVSIGGQVVCITKRDGRIKWVIN